MLALQGIDKRYKDGTHALKEVSLELDCGMIGLLGPNGAGKSSLMRTLACLQAPDFGSYAFEGENCLENPMELRQKLGYLPQYFGVYPNMSCASLLEHIAVLKGLPAKKYRPQIDFLLELTNLSAVAGKSVASFSGGMKQRFGIAQALLGDPKLIIMDEPTSGLDPAERERLHDVLVEVSTKKLIILSTHIVEDIENLCHHVAMLISGKIVESADVKQLIAPLESKVWASDIYLPNSSDSTNQTTLSKSYKFGKPSWRIYSDQKPMANATLVEANLEDRYFLELHKQAQRHVSV
ncbi:ABC transporter ATP-binding protein [Thalassotalea nanhaiensis]|uniref:ABC transporter ATP-binding protein n=1 Tax=Thalassotalea nanhaiensis TaxID=3065648 RepID=A0ABY9TEF2_9GAMM|nr:ABC transporter ATP-binding protein [Colwelliaceae bacterium SQ345]